MRLQLIILAALAGCATPPKPAVAVKAEQVAFELADLDGQTVKTSDFEGKVVLVDFWATWCKPCEASFPFYDALSKKFGAQGFVVLGVSVDAEDQDVRAFLDRKPVGFKILRDPEGSVPERFDLQTMPTAVLIGRDGNVRHVHEGFRSDDEAKITELVEAALAEPDEAAAPGARPRT